MSDFYLRIISFAIGFSAATIEIMKENFRTLLGEDRYPDNKTYIDKALAGETVNFERNSHSGNRQ